MENKEKAEQILNRNFITGIDLKDYKEVKKMLMKMAEWKDKEFEKQLKIQKFKENLMESAIGTQAIMIEELLNDKKD